jgi:flagellar hook-associated protein 2
MGTTPSVFAPVTFTGISTYSTDFQSILTRQQAIDQIPITDIQNQITDIASQDTSLGTLSTAVSALGQVLQTIGALGSGGTLSASTTDATAVTATVTGATTPASYSITNITSVASAASETTTQGYPDTTTTTVSSNGTLNLVVGTTTYPITLAAGQNNLTGLQAAINAIPNSGVTASIITANSGATGNYLSVTAGATGATTLQLNDDPVTGAPTNLLTATDQGSNSVFDLNGIAVTEPGTTINDVIPGVTLNILGPTIAGETVGVSLTSDPTLISSALQSLVTNYNAVATQVNAQIGPSAGQLNGNNIIDQLSQALSQIVQYQGTGALTNLADLGIEIGTDGTMSFNQTTFSGLSDSQLASSLSLLGSSTSGIGGLQSAFNAVGAAVTGTIAEQETTDTATTAQLNAQIATLTAHLTTSETTLNTQLEAADASVADLTSERNLRTASIASLNFTSFGYQSQSGASG